MPRSKTYRLFYLFMVLLAMQIVSSCNVRCITVPGCWFSPGPTTKVSHGKYYQKRFHSAPSSLSTEHLYVWVDSLDRSDKYEMAYRIRSFLFYSNGLVYEQNYLTNYLPADTVHTFKDDLKRACCHAWTIGNYEVSGDTVRFATRSGEMKEWRDFSGKLYENRIVLFELPKGESTFPKTFLRRDDVTVLKDRKIR